MNIDIKKWGITALVSAVVAFGAIGIVKVLETPIDIPETTKGEQGVQGDRGDMGERGWTGQKGLAGKDGKDGMDGKDGIDGKSTKVDIVVLANMVADELEDRDDALFFTANGIGGDSTLTFTIADGMDYLFTLKHYGADNFIVSLEDKDGFMFSLIDTSGHVNMETIRGLAEETYKVHISADGDWIINIEKN